MAFVDSEPVEHVLEGGQGEGKSLATASLGDADDVAPTTNDRPTLGLNRGGLVEVLYHAHYFSVRAEVGEVLNGFVDFRQAT